MMTSYGWQNFAGQWSAPLGMGFLAGIGGLLLFLLVLWSIYWKGRALWHSARQGEKVWFVALLIINTAGILEILYLYVFSKKSKSVG